MKTAAYLYLENVLSEFRIEVQNDPDLAGAIEGEYLEFIAQNCIDDSSFSRPDVWSAYRDLIPTYEMFTAAGDQRLHAIVTDALAAGDKWDSVESRVAALADEEGFEEASENCVRWAVYCAIGGESAGDFDQ
jgi:hypothetical protein